MSSLPSFQALPVCKLRIPLRRPLFVGFAQRSLPTTTSRSLSSSIGGAKSSSPLPRILRPSLWKSIIPRPLKRDEANATPPRTPEKEWHPSVFFIVIFLLIGSSSINLLGARRSFEKFSRQADARIGRLREVIERIQRGESVDVEKALGTGNPEDEKEWEEVLKEIQSLDPPQATKDSQPKSASRSAKLRPITDGKNFDDGAVPGAKHEVDRGDFY